MCSCILRILFRVYGIFCMIMHEVLYRIGEMCGNKGARGNLRKFESCLELANLWKNLWTVCITFCISREKTVGRGQKRGKEPNFYRQYPVFAMGSEQHARQKEFRVSSIALCCPQFNPT